jgi:HAD superfamily hydrolase (TIGR01490 family)
MQEPSSQPIVAFFDVDNTILRGASLYHLGRGAFRIGMVTFRDVITAAWRQAHFLRSGENQRHLDSIRERGLQIIAGHTQKQLRALSVSIFDRDIKKRLWPETVALTREHLHKGHEVWLITATAKEVADVIAHRLGLNGALGTVLEEHDGVYSGNLVGGILHGERKATAAAVHAAEMGARLEDCWAYSDSRNDIPLLELVGHPVVVNPDAGLRRHAAENGWHVMEMKRSSIRAAQKAVRYEARSARADSRKRQAREEPGASPN